MATAAARTAATAAPVATSRRSGRIGLVVVLSVGFGLAVGLVLSLGVFAGGAENEITGGALVALGAGFALLAGASTRFTDQPQRWALGAGVAAAAVGGAVLVLSPGERTLTLAGWVWPVLLLALVVWSFRGGRRSLQSWSRRAVLYPGLVVLAAAALGGAVETVAEAASSNPAPTGHSYLVNGHSLYLDCVGAGSPTVVLFNGLGERTPNWALVQRSVARGTRVCSFDRAGQGWSRGAAIAQDGHQLADDLHGLLRAAHVPGPYVLAGHSTGGVYALVYAADYPKQVAGVALVDSATPYQFDLPDYPAFYSMWRRASALLPSLARTGLGRITLRSGFDAFPPDARDAARKFASSPRELEANKVEFLQLRKVMEQAKALKSLDGKPLAVLTAPVGAQRGWGGAQADLAKLSTRVDHETVVGASHSALLEDRAFAATTSRAIAEVVQAARADGAGG